MKKAQTPARKFYFMVAATIVFNIQDGENVQMSMVPINGVVTSDNDSIPTHLLGQAQQVVQMQFFKKIGDDAKNIKIVDVVINNMIKLGHFTEEEFQAVPEGVQKQEKPELKVVAKGSDTVQ